MVMVARRLEVDNTTSDKLLNCAASELDQSQPHCDSPQRRETLVHSGRAFFLIDKLTAFAFFLRSVQIFS